MDRRYIDGIGALMDSALKEEGHHLVIDGSLFSGYNREALNFSRCQRRMYEQALRNLRATGEVMGKLQEYKGPLYIFPAALAHLRENIDKVDFNTRRKEDPSLKKLQTFEQDTLALLHKTRTLLDRRSLSGWLKEARKERWVGRDELKRALEDCFNPSHFDNPLLAESAGFLVRGALMLAEIGNPRTVNVISYGDEALQWFRTAYQMPFYDNRPLPQGKIKVFHGPSNNGVSVDFF